MQVNLQSTIPMETSVISNYIIYFSPYIISLICLDNNRYHCNFDIGHNFSFALS